MHLFRCATRRRGAGCPTGNATTRRYLKSFSEPSPLTAGKIERYSWKLPDVDHVFLPGHRIMVQVQSTLFPLYDRNPQTYVDNIDQQRYLLNGKRVEVDIETLATPVLRGHPQAFLIAVTNLIRNAFEQTPGGQGPITVLLKEHELLVTNRLGGDGNGRFTPAGPTSSGHGLGLGIVERLCERNGWEFSLHVDEAHVTACLSW